MRGPTMQVYEDYSAFASVKNLAGQLDATGISPLDEFSYSLKSNFDKMRY